MKNVNVISLGVSPASSRKKESGRKVSDRLWGIATIGRTMVTFWGTATGNFRFMLWDRKERAFADLAAATQVSKGYVFLQKGQIEKKYPQLEQKIYADFKLAEIGDKLHERVNRLAVLE